MLNETSPVRVDYDDLELDDQFALNDGKPFTGTVFSRHPDGSLESQGSYVEGLPEGVQEEWYPGGQIARRWIALRGQGSSEAWSWYTNGAIRSYRRNVEQRPVDIRAWDKLGNPIDPSLLRD